MCEVGTNTSELDYYLLPRLDLPDQEIRVSNKNSADLECFRFDDLNFFYGSVQPDGDGDVGIEPDRVEPDAPALVAVGRRLAASQDQADDQLIVEGQQIGLGVAGDVAALGSAEAWSMMKPNRRPHSA